MEILDSIASINDVALKEFIVRTVGHELSHLNEPCYYPQFHKYQYDIYKYTGLNKEKVKEFTKRFWKGTKWSKFDLTNDEYTMLLIYLMNHYLNKDDKLTYKLIMLFHIVRIYGNLMHVFFSKFCNKDVFKYTMDNITKTHLFVREQTISKAIMFLSDEMEKKFDLGIKTNNVDKVGAFILEIRGRMSQSIKSFATLYYSAVEKGLAYKNPHETEDDQGHKTEENTISKLDKLVDELSKKLCVYKYNDIKAGELAKEISRVRKEYAVAIQNRIHDLTYLEDVKMFYRLLLSEFTDANLLCKPKFLEHVKQQLAIKRFTTDVNFKQIAINLTEKVLRDVNLFHVYDGISIKSKFTIITFVTLYLAITLKNIVCHS